MDATKYFLQTMYSDPEAPFIFFKVRLNNTYIEELPLKNLKMHKGIWVDVFPYVNAAKCVCGKKVQYYLRCCYQFLQCKYYHRYAERKRVATKIVDIIPDRGLLLIKKAILAIIKFCGRKNSNEVFVFGNDSYEKSFVKREFIEHTTLSVFENTKLFVPLNADEYLKHKYGDDYMMPKKWGHQVDLDNVSLN